MENIKSIIRHALTFAAGFLGAKAVELGLDEATIEAIAGGVTAIVGVAWSLLKNKKG